MVSGRLLIDEPQDGVWNMSLDQALLEAVDADPVPTLRVYRWNPPTLSLGYFQTYASRQQHIASTDLAVVRRASGGGAIVHDRELTYSLVVPVQGRWSSDHRELYDSLHIAMRDVLWECYQIRAELFEPGDVARMDQAEQPQPFLCFQRRAPGDLIVEGFKIGGSAQRRSKRSLLQHGSLLLEQSSFAPELPGLSELSGAAIDPVALQSRLVQRIAQTLAFSFEEWQVSDSLRRRAEEIGEERFAAATWTQNR